MKVRSHNTDFILRLSGTGSGSGPYIAIHDGFQGVWPFISYNFHDVLISDHKFSPHSLLFGKGMSDIFNTSPLRHLPNSLTVTLLLSSFLPGADRLALDQHPVSKFFVDFCIHQKILDGKLNCYRNLVSGIHRR